MRVAAMRSVVGAAAVRRAAVVTVAATARAGVSVGATAAKAAMPAMWTQTAGLRTLDFGGAKENVVERSALALALALAWWRRRETRGGD